MRTLIVTKFQIRRNFFSVLIFYLAYLCVICFLSIMRDVLAGSISGMDIASAVFLLVTGLCCFKESFYFFQSCGVSRCSFYWGTVLAGIPFAFGMALVNSVLNSIYNLFVPHILFHDLLFSNGGLRDALDKSHAGVLTPPSWDTANFLRGFLWMVALFFCLYFLGMMISLIFYRSNKMLKATIGAGAWLLVIVLLPLCVYWFPGSMQAIGRFLAEVFFTNDLISAGSLIVLGVLFAGGAYLLLRRAVVKR